MKSLGDVALYVKREKDDQRIVKYLEPLQHFSLKVAISFLVRLFQSIMMMTVNSINTSADQSPIIYLRFQKLKLQKTSWRKPVPLKYFSQIK